MRTESHKGLSSAFLFMQQKKWMPPKVVSGRFTNALLVAPSPGPACDLLRCGKHTPVEEPPEPPAVLSPSKDKVVTSRRLWLARSGFPFFWA